MVYLEDEVVSFSAMLLQCHMPKGWKLHQHCCENLDFHVYKLHVCAASLQFPLFTILPFFPPLVIFFPIISLSVFNSSTSTHLSFFLWSKFLNQHSLLHLCTTLLTVTWYVLLSTAEIFSALKRKSCQKSCTYLLKQDLCTTDSFPLQSPQDKFTHLCAKEQGQ